MRPFGVPLEEQGHIGDVGCAVVVLGPDFPFFAMRHILFKKDRRAKQILSGISSEPNAVPEVGTATLLGTLVAAGGRPGTDDGRPPAQAMTGSRSDERRRSQLRTSRGNAEVKALPEPRFNRICL